MQMPSGLYKPTRGCRSKQRTFWISPHVMCTSPQKPRMDRPEWVNARNATLAFSSYQIEKRYCCVCVCLSLEGNATLAKKSIFKPQLGSRSHAKGRRAPSDVQKQRSENQSKGGRFSSRQSGAGRLPGEFLRNGRPDSNHSR